LNELISLQARQGRTIVLVTHHLSDILPEMERVAFLHEGRILADGPKQDMLTSRRLSELFNTRLEVVCHEGRYALV